MRKRLWLALACCVAVLAGGLTGCKKAKSDNPYKNVNLTFYYSYVPKDDDKNIFNAAAERWKADTGGTVTMIHASSWETRISKLMTLIATGDSPDLATAYYTDIPIMVIKNAYRPLGDLIDFQDENLSESRSKKAFEWNGKLYGAATKVEVDEDIQVIIYNETLFRNNGMKTPMQHFNEGTWNWDTFRQTCIDMTQDTDNNDEVDQFGYGSWLDELFMISNGVGDYIKESNGQVSLALDDPKFTEAATFVQNLFNKDKVIHTDHWGWKEAFQNRKIAMTAERPYVVGEMINAGFTDDIGIAPFPTNSANTSDTRYGTTISGYSLLSGSKNPEAAALFLQEYYIKAAAQQEKPKDKYQGLSDEEKAMLNTISPYAQPARFNGYGGFFDLTVEFWSDINNQNLSISSTVSKFQPMFQAQIDEVINNTEIPELEKFDPIPTIDFNGGMDPIVDNAQKEGAVSLVEGAEAIDKQSLKLVFPAPGEDQDHVILAATDPAKAKLPGGHYYTVKVDYKLLEPLAQGATLFVQLRPKEDLDTWDNAMGWIALSGTPVTSGTLEGVIESDAKLKDICLVIGAQGEGVKVVIDNIRITEE